MRLGDVKLGQAEPVADRQGPVQVIAVTAGRRAAGKTTVAVNLAMALARSGRRTLLLDADLGNTNVDALLGLQAGHTLFDVVHGHCKVQDVIKQVASGLKVIPAAAGIGQLSDLDSRECAGLVHAVSELQEPLDTLIVDTSSHFPECVASFCRAATEVLLLVESGSESIAAEVAHMHLLADRFGIRHFRMLANRAGSAAEGRALFEQLLAACAENHDFCITYTGHIPHDSRIEAAAKQNKSMVAAYPECHAAQSITGLARTTMTWPVPDQAAGHLAFFLDRLIHNENASVEATA